MAVTTSHSREMNFRRIAGKVQPSTLFIIIIFAALIFFEVFNFSTTEFALHDLLGSLNFIGLPWATILALAFCGIDLAGLARLLAPARTKADPKETWYLFGAWLLAAAMNAALTWWGVSLAIVNHSEQSAAVISQTALLRVVPVFIAILVWVIRVLIIGSITYSFERLADKTRTASPNVVAPLRSSAAPLNGVVNHSAQKPLGFQNTILRPIRTSQPFPPHGDDDPA